ncbi:MAG TPA: NFACT RNA binding domain-containing protein [Longimicrobiales bacterium]|nr:NFACT RNA binding domain-containing protein [Longimicrobiales bacterium]
MSNRIRFDPLLVRHLAHELAGRLRGQRARALRLDPGARLAALELERETLLLDLHPTRGWIRIGGPPAAPKVVDLPRRSAVAEVSAPADERLLVIELAGGPPDRVRRIVVELMTNQWNVVALDAAGRIAAVLWSRRAGVRELRAGVPYAAPEPAGREGAEAPIGAARWRELLGGVAPAERSGVLLERVAYASPINAGAILGEAAATEDDAELMAAHARYAALVGGDATSPQVLELPSGLHPYPMPLPGLPRLPVRTLVEAFEVVSGAVPAAPAGAAPELVDRVRRRLAQLERRAERLRAEAEGGAAEAVALRRSADLLLSQLRAVPRGAARATLSDFAGGEVEVELDPALGPAENARRLYDVARRRERASERIPALLRRAGAEATRLRDLLDRAERGEAPAEELEAAMPAATPTGGTAAAGPRSPFRRYRTSGGLEVRVGRGGRDNDELTLRHSSPQDIWLHARDAAGAHVILRWTDAEANPPHRDLVEAATLAALHSRARTSGVVAVDWTRRKYVRKPRKAPPGRVAPERVKTLFVEPDEALERRMKEAGEGAAEADGG